jgi:hypothetical protein
LATFVLVHGAWGGSWAWHHVQALLEARGHEVHAPTLTSVTVDCGHFPSVELPEETARVLEAAVQAR